MSLMENFRDFSKYIKPFAMLVGSFLGLLLLGFLVAGIFGFNLDTVILIILAIFFIGMLAISVKVFA